PPAGPARPPPYGGFPLRHHQPGQAPSSDALRARLPVDEPDRSNSARRAPHASRTPPPRYGKEAGPISGDATTTLLIPRDEADAFAHLLTARRSTRRRWGSQLVAKWEQLGDKLPENEPAAWPP